MGSKRSRKASLGTPCSKQPWHPPGQNCEECDGPCASESFLCSGSHPRGISHLHPLTSAGFCTLLGESQTRRGRDTRSKSYCDLEGHRRLQTGVRLKGDGQDQLWSLVTGCFGAEGLTARQRTEKFNCEKKIADFEVRRGLSMWEGVICKTRAGEAGERRGNWLVGGSNSSSGFLQDDK